MPTHHYICPIDQTNRGVSTYRLVRKQFPITGLYNLQVALLPLLKLSRFIKFTTAFKSGMHEGTNLTWLLVLTIKVRAIKLSSMLLQISTQSIFYMLTIQHSIRSYTFFLDLIKLLLTTDQVILLLAD